MPRSKHPAPVPKFLTSCVCENKYDQRLSVCPACGSSERVFGPNVFSMEEAQNQLSEITRRARDHGEESFIRRYNSVIAKIVPLDPIGGQES